jgi:hypothetical protein
VVAVPILSAAILVLYVFGVAKFEYEHESREYLSDGTDAWTLAHLLDSESQATTRVKLRRESSYGEPTQASSNATYFIDLPPSTK